MKLSKNKFFNIFFFSFTISTILFYSSKINILKKVDTKIRNLLTDSEIEEICKKGKQSLNELYLKNTYEYELNYKNDKYVQYLIDFLHTKDFKNLIHYAPRVLFLLLILIIDILFIFFFFGYCCCICCCPCQKCQCGCYQNVKKMDFCTKLSFILSFIFFCVCMISSFLGIDYEKKLTESLNSTSCSIFKIYAHFIFGDDCNEIPKWPGFGGIKNIIQNTVVEVNVTKKYTSKVINYYNGASNINIFENNFIENEYKKFDKNDFTTNIIVDGINNSSKSVYFDLYYDLKTNLNYTFLDYEYLSNVFEVLKEIKDIAVEIDSNNQIEVKLNDSILQLDDINGTFDELSSKVLDELYKYQKDYNKYSGKGILLFFLILSIFPAISIISLILFIAFCECSRFFFYFSWMINMLIIISFTIIGVIAGILGIIGKDGVGVMEYIISNENLEKMDDSIIIKGEGSKYLNTCFNGDGDLQSVLDLNSVDSNGTGSLNELYQKKEIVDNMSIYLNTFPGWFTELILLENTFNNFYQSNEGFKFYDSSTNEKSSLSEVINQLRTYTDKTKNSSAQFYHWWTISELNCDNDYKITSEPTSSNEKYCLILSENTTCLQSYNDIQVDDNHNLCNIFDNYKNSILNFYNKYYESLYNLEEIFGNYVDNNLNYIKGNTTLGIHEGIYMIEPIYKIYNKFLGGNNANIFSVLNCRFLKKDSYILFDVLNKDLGYNSRKISYFIFISCFSSAIGIFFGIIGVLRKFNKKTNTKTKLDDNTNSKKENVTAIEENKNESSQDLQNNDNNNNINTITNQEEIKLDDIGLEEKKED